MENDNPFAASGASDEDFSDEAIEARVAAQEAPEDEDAEESEEESEEVEEDDDSEDSDEDDSEDDDAEEEAEEDDEPEAKDPDLSKWQTIEAARKSAYDAELRMREKEREALELRKQLEARQTPDEDIYDNDAFRQTAQDRPQDAFRYAINNGAFEDAQSVIAQVQSDAQGQAVLAEAARAGGDQEAYQEAAQWVRQINGIAEGMRQEMYAAQQTINNKPMVDRQLREDMQYAWDKFSAEETVSPEAVPAMQKILQQRPYLMVDDSGKMTRESALEGYRLAARIATPASNNNDALRDEVREELRREMLDARKKNASSARGEAGSGKAKSSSKGSKSEAELIKEEILGDVASSSIGHRKFMAI